MHALARSIAFFISPDGTVLHVPDASHIAFIIRQPALFGYNRPEIEEICRRHNEPLGQEGNAREEIPKQVIRRGWMRLRRYPNQYWTLNVCELHEHARDALCRWAQEMLTGEGGFREADRFMPVHIDTPVGCSENHTIPTSPQE